VRLTTVYPTMPPSSQAYLPPAGEWDAGRHWGTGVNGHIHFPEEIGPPDPDLRTRIHMLLCEVGYPLAQVDYGPPMPRCPHDAPVDVVCQAVLLATGQAVAMNWRRRAEAPPRSQDVDVDRG
jgi:hypothetical protein